MNYRMVAYSVGRITAMASALMLLPLFVALYYDESIKGFLIAIAVGAVLSALAVLFSKPKNRQIFSKEGFVTVSLSWIIISLIGAIPFTVEGEIPSYIDAIFETVSGFTTTGASILENVEALSRGLLFWRSFTHWLGGMGIIVLMLAVFPLSNKYSMYIMKAEVPGPVKGKLVPKMQDSSVILYMIYVALTAFEIIFLLIGKMPLYDAILHSFGTAGTGGFGIKSLSVGYYNSAYIDIVIGIFMALFGVNFNMYFLLLMKKYKTVIKNEELLWYIGIIAFSTVTIAVNIKSLYGSFFTSLRYSFFQVSSIVTTTGFSTADFNRWPEYSKMLLVLLMFIGGCAGSTGGGIKVARIIMMKNTAKSEVKHMLRPRSYNQTKLNGEVLDKQTIHGTLVFFLLYIFIILISCFLLSLENFDAVTTVTGVIACVSNIGPGLSLVGPMGSFAIFSPAAKLLLSFCMLLGRLEIFPVLLLFSPYTWKKSSRF
ncbi:MAG: TrkH family potassium uptake protein [Clostridia bacterium]|nr:TrkH family potassium uptake protein [Clostridia bacterium]